MKYFCGIDIGGSSAKIGLLDQQGNLHHFREVPVNFDAYQTPILETVMTALTAFLKEIPHPVEGIGVSAAGQIDVNAGTVIGTCGNLPNYIGSDFKAQIETRFGLPATVVNDANCMILGESWLGAAQGHSNIVGITIGTGVGGGILVNGQILNGASGLAGEVGHFILHQNGIPCTCGNLGCYEQYASMTGLIRQAKASFAPGETVNGKTIFARMKTDASIRTIVDAWIEDIAAGLVSLVHIFNPTVVIIGGGVSVEEEALIAPIRQLVLKNVMPRFADRLEVVAATLGNNAGLIGAVHYFIQHHSLES